MADAKQGKTPLEDFYNGSPQSRVVLAKPRLGAFGGASNFPSSSSKTCNPFGSVLRPSQLKPGTNPFLKVGEDKEEKTEDSEKEVENSGDIRLSETKDDVEAPKFVPLGSANVTARTTAPAPAPSQPASSSSSSSSGFVFGQNLSERVVIQQNMNNGEVTPADHSSSNGTSELLFTSAAASVKENNQEEAGPSEAQSSRTSEGLAAAAAEYERSHARPPPPTTNYNLTGEEGEINVLQISCRLFAWESGSWRERGRGVLRLNDAEPGTGGAARLVARVAGSLRVVLNTKLWPDMVVQRAGTKSLRITAADAQQQIKLFLIMGAPSDIAQLHRALSARIAVSKPAANSCAQNTNSQQAAERLEAATSEHDFLDKPADDVTTTVDDLDQPDPTHITDDQTNTDQTKDDDRLQDQKTDDTESAEASKLLKRKEPIAEETTPKRQCPEIIIE